MQKLKEIIRNYKENDVVILDYIDYYKQEKNIIYKYQLALELLELLDLKDTDVYDEILSDYCRNILQ